MSLNKLTPSHIECWMNLQIVIWRGPQRDDDAGGPKDHVLENMGAVYTAVK